jgi:hypothetical protein
VLALGDVEIVVGAVILPHAVRQVSRPNAEQGRRTIHALCTPEPVDSHHGTRKLVPNYQRHHGAGVQVQGELEALNSI